jgi:hypothetical protein
MSNPTSSNELQLIQGIRRRTPARMCKIICAGWPSWLFVVSALSLECTDIFIDHLASPWCQQLVGYYSSIAWHPLTFDQQDWDKGCPEVVSARSY